MLLELIVIIFIKSLGAAISGHWVCKTRGLRETMTVLLWSLGWQSGLGPGWQCECMAHTLPGAVPVAHWTQAFNLRISS